MEISHCTYLSFIDLHHHLILRLRPLVRLTYTSNKNYKLYNGRSRCFNGCVVNKYRITLGNTVAAGTPHHGIIRRTTKTIVSLWASPVQFLLAAVWTFPGFRWWASPGRWVRRRLVSVISWWRSIKMRNRAQYVSTIKSYSWFTRPLYRLSFVINFSTIC